MKDFQLQPYSIKNNVQIFLNWKVIRYSFLFAFFSLIVSCLLIFNYKSQTVFLIVRLVDLLLFVGLGILHSDFLEKRPIFIHHSIREKFYFSFVLSSFIYGILLLFYFIEKTDLQRMALAGSCAFLLPYMIVQAWNYYLLIPENKPMIWSGYKKIGKSPEIVYLNTLLINIRLSRKSNFKEETSFLINTPLNMELGNIFNSFLNVEKKEDEIAIECLTQDNRPYNWKFFLVSFGGLYKRILDPEKSLQNNMSIKRNATILAKRVIPDDNKTAVKN